MKEISFYLTFCLTLSLLPCPACWPLAQTELSQSTQNPKKTLSSELLCICSFPRQLQSWQAWVSSWLLANPHLLLRGSLFYSALGRVVSFSWGFYALTGSFSLVCLVVRLLQGPGPSLPLAELVEFLMPVCYVPGWKWLPIAPIPP